MPSSLRIALGITLVLIGVGFLAYLITMAQLVNPALVGIDRWKAILEKFIVWPEFLGPLIALMLVMLGWGIVFTRPRKL